VQHLLEERIESDHQLLANARQKLDKLAQVLLQEETVDQDKLTKILGVRWQAKNEINQPADTIPAT
jgi:ATP-dependent Zn protease